MLKAPLFCALVVLSNSTSATVLGTSPELDNLYQQARTMLDESDGPPPEAALKLLELVIGRDEEYAPAYVELARFVLKSSYLHTYSGIDRFSDDGQTAALALLDRAAELEPGFADTWLLFGYLLPALERPMLGLMALNHAEQLGSHTMWLPYNRARIHAVVGNLDEARSDYLTARASVAKGSGTHIAILSQLTTFAHSEEEADGYYKELLRVAPDEAWIRENYVEFLIRKGRFDEAIEFARTALRVAEHPRLRGSLALALYAKAADLELNKHDPVNAGAVFIRAEQVGYPVVRVLHDASAYKTTRHVVFALAARGVDINAPMQGGRTVLFNFLTDGTEAQVRELLALGADPNARDEAMGPALHVAAISMQSPELVQALLDAGADATAKNRRGESAMEVAMQRNLSDIEQMLEKASGPIDPRWAPIVDGVRAGNVADMQRALMFLQTQDPENVAVLTALQESVAEMPSIVLPLTNGFGGIMQKMCGPPTSDDPRVSVQRRLEAVNTAAQTSGDRPPYGLSLCRRDLVQAPTATPTPSIPRHPTAEERPALLARATELFTAHADHDSRLSQAEEIVLRLTSSDASDVAAQLLLARINLTQGEEMATHRGLADRYSPQALVSAVDNLERALQHEPNSQEALKLYSHVLDQEGHVALRDLVAAKAGITP